MKDQLGKIMWAPNDQGNGGDDSTPPAGSTGGEGDTGGTRTFTQEELNAIVGERATRARSAAISDLLGELGFEKADELKALVQSAREQADKQKSETQKLQEKLAEYEKKEASWAQQRREQALQIAVQAAAQKVGIVDAEVALALVRGGITFDEQDAPQGVEAALTELVKSKPYLRAGAGNSANPTNPGRQGGSKLTREQIARMTPEQINANWSAVQAALAEE